jgi:hypothetical protein
MSFTAEYKTAYVRRFSQLQTFQAYDSQNSLQMIWIKLYSTHTFSLQGTCRNLRATDISFT